MLVLMLMASGASKAVTHSSSIQPLQPILHGDPGGGGPDPTGGGGGGGCDGGCLVAIH